MSYCRWSDEDFQCDVYCYRSDQGYTTHVAGNRIAFADCLPDPVSLAEDYEAWCARHRAVMRIIDASDQEPIGGPYDGERFDDQTPAAAADRLEQLRAAGYHVPQYAIDALREEARA